MIPNIDVFEAEFGAITVTGAKGWSAQQGETSLDSRMGVDSDDDSVPVDMDISEHMGETSNRGGCSKQKKGAKRRIRLRLLLVIKYWQRRIHL